MKLRDLFKELDGFHLDMEIIVSRDEEGNGFSPLASWSEQYYTKDGDIFNRGEEDEFDETDEVKKVIVLWPSH